MLWLKSLTESDDKNYLKIKGNEDAYQIEKILKNQLRHQYLSTELEKMFRLDSSQNTEIAGENLLFYKKSHSQQIKSIVSSLFTSANEEYSETIERNSLKVDTKNNSGYIMPFQSSSETRLMSFFDLLKNPSQNQYFLFYTENHAMAVTVIHQNGQRYWTFSTLILALTLLINIPPGVNLLRIVFLIRLAQMGRNYINFKIQKQERKLKYNIHV